MKKLFFFLLAFIFILYSCKKEELTTDTIYQVSRLDTLAAGHYAGQITYRSLSAYGDFGLGTFNAVDGEMIYLDNEFFRVRTDGVAYLVADEATTPFANVTYFEADQSVELKELKTLPELEDYLDVLLPDQDGYYAVRIEGLFENVKTRSVHAQQKPYPSLNEVIADQVTFEFNQVRGTMVGFRFPEEVGGANVHGYHFHFITEDRDKGGHLLDCTTKEVEIGIDVASGVETILK